MTIHKCCADHLRAQYTALTGGKLSSGHAHELVAAFFGYSTGSALRAETQRPLDLLSQAHIMIPDLQLLDVRRNALAGLPGDLPGSDDIADLLSDHLSSTGQYTGDVWLTRDLVDHNSSDFLQDNASRIEDALSGEIASTNAYFDELYPEEVTIDRHDQGLTANVTGHLNGENDQDRAFHGDSIAFETEISFDLVAGRTGYSRPSFSTTGAVDDSRYYEE